MLKVIDDFNQEVLGIEVDFSLPVERLIQALEQIISRRRKLKEIRCDNGTENVSGEVQTFCRTLLQVPVKNGGDYHDDF